MAVTVAKNDNDDNLDLSTVSSKKRQSVMNVKSSLDKLFEERNIKISANNSGLEYIDLYGYPIDTTDLTKLPKEEAKKHRIGIFAITNKLVKFATPNYNESLQGVIIDSFRQKGYDTKVYLCSEESFDKLLNTYEFTVSYKNTGDDFGISEDRLNKLAQNGVNLNALTEDIANISVTELVERILVGAIENDASDIHIEPEKENCILRFRLDGVLHVFAKFDKETQKKLESRVKILSKLKLNVDNVPQDGRFSFRYKEKEIDLRVSMLPSNYGYSIVMRLLGVGSIALELDALGFAGEAKRRVETEIKKSQGLILAAGPTGSGKTTTLYTFLSHINTGESKIITLEDPIEYKLAGISQTQIDAAAGYTFSSGLRSILRQDPDAVMVGEIRDEATAEVSVQASLTGHKVLSTIHTNDAIGAIPRFMEMDIEGYLIADSLSLVVGQRLLRRLCNHCKREVSLTDDQKNFVINNLESLPESSSTEIPPELAFYTSDGCDRCNNLGYKGRVGVYEVLTMTDGLRALLMNEKPSFVDLRRVAISEGMVTMQQDAVIKALQGITDMDEIERVVG